MSSVKSHLAWGAWIETTKLWVNKIVIIGRTSHEVRGLKPYRHTTFYQKILVAPRMRCVDWNDKIVSKQDSHYVAPRMRCVDWNLIVNKNEGKHLVAPRMRCVDWNIDEERNFLCRESHLAWGAWIETWQSIMVMVCSQSRTSHEVRGLKPGNKSWSWHVHSRTSHEVRGLKPL